MEPNFSILKEIWKYSCSCMVFARIINEHCHCLCQAGSDREKHETFQIYFKLSDGFKKDLTQREQ